MAGRWWVLGRRASVGYTVVAAAVLFAGLAGVWSIREARQAGDASRRAVVVSNEFAELTLDVVEAETGQRGFLLTGDENYLGPYTERAGLIAQRLKRLRQLTAGDTAQQERLGQLEGLVATKLAELDKTIGYLPHRSARTTRCASSIPTAAAMRWSASAPRRRRGKTPSARCSPRPCRNGAVASSWPEQSPSAAARWR